MHLAGVSNIFTGAVGFSVVGAVIFSVGFSLDLFLISSAERVISLTGFVQ
jgi:hypothetical protein